MSEEKFEGKSTLSPNPMHDNIQPQQRFTGYFIPVEIMEIENLSWFEKILLSMVDSLHCKQHGGCFASNEYLASKLKMKVISVRVALKNLRKAGLIEDVSFNGRKRVIRTRMYEIADQIKNQNPSNITQGDNILSGRPIKNYQAEGYKNISLPLYSDNKGYKKEKRGGKPPSANADSPPRSNSSSKEKTIERAQHVGTSDEEHQKLVELYGEEMTAKAYEVLSLWKQDTPKSKWKKSDYRSIRRWTIDAVKEKRKKEGSNPVKQETINEVKTLHRNFTFKSLCEKKGLSVQCNAEDISFIREGVVIEKIKFFSPDLVEKFHHFLKKFGIIWSL